MRDHRRLAAIISADVVGYSRLMGRDESGTLAGLKAHRQALIDPKIAEYGGRIVKTTGDGLLLEFPSVVDSVRCAVDMQRGMAERNACVPVEDRIAFRVGINIGDIIIDGDDIFGDGVNVAARLQALADPGGICVSRIVRDQVLDKLSFAFEDLGAKEVKNIARPVEAYRVHLGSSSPLKPAGRMLVESMLRRLGWQWPFAAALAVGLVGIGLWAVPSRHWKNQPVFAPPALSVAILPFTAPGGTAAEKQLAEGLARDLTVALGQWRFATVASFRSASQSSSKSSDVRELARELNVRFLTEGEVHRTGAQVVVNLQLVDAATGNQVSSERLAFEQMHDHGVLVTQLNRRLRDALIRAESRRVGTAGGASAVELTLRAANVENTASDALAGAVEAGRLYDKAIDLDPTFTTAMVARIDNLHNQLFLSQLPRAQHQRNVAQMDELSRRALAVDDRYPPAYLQQTEVHYYAGLRKAGVPEN